VRFGQQGVSGSPKKEGESESYRKRRKSFKSRHAKNIAKGPSSAAYWANKVKWAEGGVVDLQGGATPANIARSVLGEGLAMGWGDEAEALVRSKLTDEAYADIIKRIRAQNEAYAEKHPIASLTGEIAGGVLPTIASFAALPFTGGASAPVAAANAGRMGLALAKLAPTAKAALIGGTQGAITGAGQAEEGDRAAGAVIGGGVGAGLGYGISKGAGMLIDAINRRAINRAASQVPDDSAYDALRQRYDDAGFIQRAVLPQGNINLQPGISAETLRGPDVQSLESFLAQVRGEPGVSRDALEELSRRYEGMPAGSMISKSEFAAQIPPSQYNTVDLKNLAGNSDHDRALFAEQAQDYLQDNPNEPYQNVLDRIGLERNEDNLDLIAGLNEGTIDTEDLPEEIMNIFRKVGWEDDIIGNLNSATESASEDLVHTITEEMAEQAGTSASGYRYTNDQRLLTEATRSALDDNNYFEIGLTHPDVSGQSYWHYPSATNAENGIIGHIRGTYIPADTTNATVRAPLVDNGRFGEATIPVRPNSVVIEEIQSDAQKRAPQTGALRQVHGTLFKAAINDALKRGADTIYLPSAATIAVPRGGVQNAKMFESIYDQQIVREALKPLSQIPGVEINPVGVNGMLAYNEITFSPEAIEIILRGRGQRTPGYAEGGVVVAPRVPGGSEDKSEEAKAWLLSRIAASAKGAFGERPVGFSPELKQQLETPGLVGLFNKYVVNPSVAAGDAALRAVPAMFAGAGTAAGAAHDELAPKLPDVVRRNLGTGDQLARDVAALPDALIPELRVFAPAVNATRASASYGVTKVADDIAAASARRAINRAAAQAPDDSAYDALRQRYEDAGAMQYAVKDKGGNWFKGSIEKAVAPLKTPATGETPAQRISRTEALLQDPTLLPEGRPIVERHLARAQADAALDRWIDTKLTKYIRNEMATPEDPVRALAEGEKGVLHYDPSPDQNFVVGIARRFRKQVGKPEENLGESDLARRWEDWSDSSTEPSTTGIGFSPPQIHEHLRNNYMGDYSSRKANATLADNPWLENLPPGTNVYHIPDVSDLGFRHLVDELGNAVDPTSTLPAHLRLTPEKLDNVTTPQAVVLVDKINKYRAAEAVKAERAGMLENLANAPRLKDDALQLSFVEKPGGTWVDLAETTSEKGLKGCTSIGKAAGWCTMEDYKARSYGSGDSRLTALLDADGRPHVQVQAVEPEVPDFSSYDYKKALSGEDRARYRELVMQWRRRNPDAEVSVNGLSDGQVLQALKDGGEKGFGPDILEIKPPGNSFDSSRAKTYAKRDPQYRIKITDSVVNFLNKGDWGKVNGQELDQYNIVDLKNPHSMQHYIKDIYEDIDDRKIAGFELTNALDKAPPEMPRFMTRGQFLKLLEPDEPQKFAEGGLVTYDPHAINQLAKQITQGFAQGGLVTYDLGAITALANKFKEDFHV